VPTLDGFDLSSCGRSSFVFGFSSHTTVVPTRQLPLSTGNVKRLSGLMNPWHGDHPNPNARFRQSAIRALTRHGDVGKCGWSQIQSTEVCPGGIIEYIV
jgi:hypothetical protein